MRSFCILLFSLYAVSAYKTIEAANQPMVESGGTINDIEVSSFRCGDRIQSSSGAISYKNFETVQPNERCVWTIRALEATSYIVTLTSLGIPNSVIISALGLPSYANHYVPDASTTLNLTNSNVLVVTFFTGPENVTNTARGFSLYFTSVTSGTNTKASSDSEDVNVLTNYGLIKFPATRNVYTAYELSVFAFVPTNGVAALNENEVLYIKGAMEGEIVNCNDSVWVFVFDISISGTNKWRRLDNICARTDFEVIRNQDLILLNFRSDSSNQYAGFQLYARSS